MPAWVSCGYSGFLPQNKVVYIRVIGIEIKLKNNLAIQQRAKYRCLMSSATGQKTLHQTPGQDGSKEKEDKHKSLDRAATSAGDGTAGDAGQSQQDVGILEELRRKTWMATIKQR